MLCRNQVFLISDQMSLSDFAIKQNQWIYEGLKIPPKIMPFLWS